MSNNTIRVFEAFAGYGSQSIALKRLANDFADFRFTVVGISEIDKHAIAAYRAIHGDHAPNFGDIMHINWLQVPDFDLLTYSFPCQDISSAGRQRGFAQGSGTRSSCLWACADAISVKHPKWLLMENVKALTQRKFAKDFYKWREWLSDQGYTSYFQVLNAKEYGIPQNRERVFMVSCLGEHPRFFFPKTFPLEYRLKDILEDNVDESYYLKPQQVESIIKHCERKVAEGCGFKVNFQSPDGISGAIKTKEGQREYDTYIKEPLNTDMHGNSRTITAHYHKLGYTDFSSDLCPHTGVMEYSTCAIRGRCVGNVQQLEVGGNVANTITTVQKDSMVLEPLFLGYTRDHKGKVVSHNLKDISNTLVASNHGRNGSTAQYLVEPMISINPIGHKLEFGGGKNCIKSISPTLRATDYKCPHVVYKDFRIRKLTPRECFRLMDVADSDIDKIQQAGISKTQQYKLAGNSIVVSCLYHLFRKMFIDHSNEQKGYVQLSLF